MKLLKTTVFGAHYLLNRTELYLLETVLQKFPFTEAPPGRISRRRRDPQAAEREKLLNQSLAEHRRELTRAARELLAGNRVKPMNDNHLLTLTPADRETLLQILNDVRVGCWYALGEPDELEPKDPDMTDQEFAWRNLMHLAGHFEHHLVEDEPEG